MRMQCEEQTVFNAVTEMQPFLIPLPVQFIFFGSPLQVAVGAFKNTPHE